MAFHLQWGRAVLGGHAGPPRSCYHVSAASDEPLARAHRRPVCYTPAATLRTPYGMGDKLETDHIREYRPPTGTQPRTRDPGEFSAMGTTTGWAPHVANRPGSDRAVYDPISHKTSLYTFTSDGSVRREDAKGDSLMREKVQRDLTTGVVWQGRRKGVVEFVDKTHFYAVNANDKFLQTCNHNERAFHPRKGEVSRAESTKSEYNAEL